jgi:hypothetical protein
VGAAVEHGDAEALGGPDHDVGAERAGRLEDGEGQQVRGDHGQGAALVGGLDDRPRVEDPAGGAGVLHQHAAEVAVGQAVGEVGHDDLDAHRVGAGADHLDGLRQGVGVDDERTAGASLGAPDERHRLGGGRALVQQAGVRSGQTGQVADHGLEVDQGLEPALRDLRLVRRVGGVPGRVLEHVAPDHRRRDRGVVAEPDHRLGRPVGGRDPAQLAGGVVLRQRLGQVQRARGDGARDRGVHQGVERVVADHLEHVGQVVGARTEVAVGEGVLHGHGWLLDGSIRLPLCHVRFRVAWSARSWRLRGSGEGLPLRRSAPGPGPGQRLSRAGSSATPL